MDAFSRYSPFIQDFIYSSGWQSLRGVQNAAADAVFNTDENVLLTASTASGKTEAAFQTFETPPLHPEVPPLRPEIGSLFREGQKNGIF